MATLTEKFAALTSALRNDEDLCDLIENIQVAIDKCCKYAAYVDTMEDAIRDGRDIYDGADYRRYVERLDRNRHYMHEGLMVDVNLLNRICGMVNIPPVADVDANNRDSYYDFAKKVDAVHKQLASFCEY